MSESTNNDSTTPSDQASRDLDKQRSIRIDDARWAHYDKVARAVGLDRSTWLRRLADMASGFNWARHDDRNQGDSDQ